MNRRQLIKAGGASLLLMSTGVGALANSPSPNKIVWVVLRGALDSLHTVIPRADNDLLKLRPDLYGDIKDQLLPLNSQFGLHPSLKHLHKMYQEKQLLPIVAVGSGYQGRSHFDGQDFLEAAVGKVETDDGWLARAINATNGQAVSVSRTTPGALRGDDNNKAVNWYPSSLNSDNDYLYDELKKLYQYDEDFAQALSMGVDIRDKADSSKRVRQQFAELATACGKLIRDDSSMNAAMLELGGWDTHNRQAQRLKQQLSQLDDGIAALRDSLGDVWQDTAVIVTTEFGRTAAQNGTAGTDHGTASAMFIVGGAIQGGQIMGEWPGLAKHQLFEQRDLMPTSNIFDWQAALLKQHWGLTDAQLKAVLPSAKLRFATRPICRII